MQKKVRVAVLMGGPSSEHEVSLKSGKKVLEHLNPERYIAEPVHVYEDGRWPFEPRELRDRADVAFIAMHGEYGEDGTVQSVLEEARIPYTGSGVHASALGMNKFLTLRLLQDRGVRIPYSMLVSKSEWLRDPHSVFRNILLYIKRPWVLKPNRCGSSVDVHIAQSPDEFLQAFKEIFVRHRDVLVQPFVVGREVTCGVLDWGYHDTAYALPPTEIVPLKGAFFNYTSKYEPHGSLEVTPARFSDAWNREIQRIAVAAHQIIQCRGLSRTDVILGHDGKAYVLEINTIPGMTETSLLPQAAVAHGISFSQLLDRIIQAAIPK